MSGRDDPYYDHTLNLFRLKKGIREMMPIWVVLLPKYSGPVNVALTQAQSEGYPTANSGPFKMLRQKFVECYKPVHLMNMLFDGQRSKFHHGNILIECRESSSRAYQWMLKAEIEAITRWRTLIRIKLLPGVDFHKGRNFEFETLMDTVKYLTINSKGIKIKSDTNTEYIVECSRHPFRWVFESNE